MELALLLDTVCDPRAEGSVQRYGIAICLSEMRMKEGRNVLLHESSEMK